MPDDKTKQETKVNRSIPSHFAVRSITRRDWENRGGLAYGDHRDLYETLGWPRDLSYRDYYDMFERNAVATRVVEAKPDESWGEHPQVIETGESAEGKQTEFETRWNNLVLDLNIFDYLARLDILAGIGTYGVLVLGFSDAQSVEDYAQPVTGSAELLYLAVYDEEQAKIQTYFDDFTDPRYGMPQTYQIVPDLHHGLSDNARSQTAFYVHADRILHFSDNRLTSDVFGTPRLQAVYNALMGIEFIYGAAPEGYWRQAYPGLMFSIDPQLAIAAEGDDSLDITDFQDHLDKYVHGMQRFLVGTGITPETLQSGLIEPGAFMDTMLKMVSVATRIPKRILEGSERGELASSQDERGWLSYIARRREKFLTPFCIRRLVDRLIKFQALPTPPEGYRVEWPDPFAPSDKELAETAKIRAEALSAFATSGAELFYSTSRFLRDLGLSEDEIEEERERAEEMIAQEEREMAEAAQETEEEETEEEETEEEETEGEEEETEGEEE